MNEEILKELPEGFDKETVEEAMEDIEIAQSKDYRELKNTGLPRICRAV